MIFDHRKQFNQVLSSEQDARLQIYNKLAAVKAYTKLPQVQDVDRTHDPNVEHMVNKDEGR